MTDQQLTCRDCNQAFTWTAGEQSFYAQKGLSAPTRCRDCRAKRKLERDQGGSGGGRGGYQSGGARDQEMYDITCAQCGKPGQVPFRPTRDDVLCRECFAKGRDSKFEGGDQPTDQPTE